VSVPGRVFRVQAAHAEEAAESLAQAFLNEPATLFFFPPEEGNRLEKLRALFGWGMEYRTKLDIPALGIFANDGQRIAGAATLRIPRMPDDMGLAEELWQRLAPVFGSHAPERFHHYEEAQKRHLHPEPHHYLVAIGVHPDFQGQGYGGALLRACIALAEDDDSSAGLGLDTGSDSNQALYEHFGFSLVGTEMLGATKARFMFRPSKVRPARPTYPGPS
jgi:ribosomal protein S18 acetylase RimI-like enzyme